VTPSLFTSVVGASGVFPVLLDTCALFGPLLRDVLLEAAWDGMDRPHWSNGILAELEKNLREKKGWDDRRINHLGVELRNAFPEALVDVPLGFEQCLTCDPKDRHVLAAAIVGECKVLVTQNTRDFPRSSTEPFGIRAVRPGTFVLDLFHLDRPQMVDCLRRMEARNTRYPQTVEEILHCRGITTQAPVFARECCEYLGLPNPPVHQ
jgi:predicted nucleic acid-binding protein